MNLNDYDSHISSIDSIISSLLEIIQMPMSDLTNFLQRPGNISSLQQSFRSLKGECDEFKRQIIKLKSQSNAQKIDSAKTYNEDFIQLQIKYSESEKRNSEAYLEIAELKKSIVTQEAQNAILTAENISLKNSKGIESEPLRKKIENFSLLNDSIQASNDEEIKKLKKINADLQNTIVQLKIDLEQTKAISDRYRDFGSPVKTKEEFIKLNAEIEQKDKLFKQSQDKIRKQTTISKRVMASVLDHQTSLEGKMQVTNKSIEEKMNNIESRMLELKAKLHFLNNLASENMNLSKKLKNLSSSLEFAMQAMANLAGVSDENMPYSTDVMENEELLEIYVSDLQAKVVEKTIEEASMPKATTKRQHLNTSIGTLNDLMAAMTEQMQNEHDILMSQISVDPELPSFRKTVMPQTYI